MKIVTPTGTLPRDSHARPIKIIRPVSFSPVDLFRELRGLWQYRDLFYTLTVHRIKVRYKQSVLGLAWAILQPLSLMLIYVSAAVFDFAIASSFLIALFIYYGVGLTSYALYAIPIFLLLTALAT